MGHARERTRTRTGRNRGEEQVTTLTIFDANRDGLGRHGDKCRAGLLQSNARPFPLRNPPQRSVESTWPHRVSLRGSSGFQQSVRTIKASPAVISRNRFEDNSVDLEDLALTEDPVSESTFEEIVGSSDALNCVLGK